MIHWLMNMDMAGGGGVAAPTPVVRGGGRIKRVRAPVRINGYAEPEPALARFTIYAPEATGAAAARVDALLADTQLYEPRTAVSVYIEGVSGDTDVREVRAAGIRNLEDEELALIIAEIWDQWIS